MSKSNLIETKVIHAGEMSPRVLGAITTPIFQSATFEAGPQGSYHEVRYTRLNNNPSQLALHDKLAALENAEAAVVTASGMGAISTTLLTLLKGGGHALVQDSLYGGTHDLITKDFAGFGLEYSFIDAVNPVAWREQLRPNTRVIYVEAMTNPTLQVADLKSVVSFAKQHGLVSVIDSTFASPVNLRPVELGFDLSLHSATKYLNGHSDVIAGAIVGRSELVQKITHQLNHLGAPLDPHAAFLLSRGIKTLALRVRHQNASALRLAQFLESHRGVRRVDYAGLASHPQHERARSLFEGFGGVLSFEPHGGIEAATRIIASVKLPMSAPSLGGVESLITRPAASSHLGLTPAERARLGISDALIRVSVGIEASDDLIADFGQALESA